MNNSFKAAARAVVIGAVLLPAMLAGCGKGGSAAPSGTYESKFGPPGNGLTLNFLGNNDVDVTISEGGRAQTKRTSFVTSGDTIVVKIPEGEGQDLTLKRNGAALETTLQGVTMHFEKL
jgi:hypothetical protein